MSHSELSEIERWLDEEIKANETWRLLFTDVSLKYRRLFMSHMLIENDLESAKKRIAVLEHQLDMATRNG